MPQKPPKNVTTIPPDAPFLDTLAAEIWAQTNGDGFKLSQYQILLPTRRACRHLGAAFARLAQNKPVLLPRMRPLGDIDEDEMSFADVGILDLPPAIAPTRRLMLLTQQVQRRDPHLSCDQALLSAEALARFLDLVQIVSGDLSLLPALVQEQELAAHWQQTLLFLDIVTQHWPSILADEGCLDPIDRRNKVLAAQTELWRNHPPAFPVVAAGSTGTVPATAELLKVIAEMPMGAVILPGLDCALDDEAWDAIDDTHPQHSMKKLLERMDISRADVQTLTRAPCRESLSPRVKLLSEALRPAALTEAWRGLRGKLDPCATEGLTRLTLNHPQEEAQVIALHLREALETPNKRAAFVTPDRQLAARVAMLLHRWGIEVDDSGGAPVSATPLGAFLDLVLAAANPHAGSVDLLALLKHPLAACGLAPAQCRAQAREAELRVRKLEAEEFASVKKLLSPLTESWGRPLPLAPRIAAHIAAAEAIAATNDKTGAERLWQGEGGEDVAAWLDEWQSGVEDFPPVCGSDYAGLYHAMASMKTLRTVAATHPNLSILGPLEARLIDADLVILGGLNEGVWPPDAGFDPWMSRPMRKKLGLPLPEFRIGLAAHDFVQLCAAKEVVLTRSLRTGGAPTVPSRFLLQIETVLRAAGLSDNTKDALADTKPWREWAQALDEPVAVEPCARPTPRPPVAVRPKALSVTEITTWLRNPYAIYAKHILRLHKLDELDAALDASDRGTMVHEALEKFSRAFPEALPPDAEARLLAIGREIFSRDETNPRVRAFWETRFAASAVWFIAQEGARRENGMRPAGIEAKGRGEIAGLTLTGRADRLDRMEDGSLIVIDYKTGAVPSKNDVRSGIEPQLQLLALILSRGGFDKLAAAPPFACEYWPLKGTKDCEITSFSQELPDLMAQAEEGLKNLIAAFADPNTPYEAAPKPRLQPRYNDYAHLSRLAEWGRTGEDA